MCHKTSQKNNKKKNITKILIYDGTVLQRELFVKKKTFKKPIQNIVIFGGVKYDLTPFYP